MIEGVGCSNGLAWSPDSRTMYFTDSHTDLVVGLRFRRRHRRDRQPPHLHRPDGRRFIVDGATVDARGQLLADHPGHRQDLPLRPRGKRIRTIELPYDLPTCCEFGGPDLDMLYVTSATLRRDAKVLAGQTKPGGLFAIRGLGAKGLPLVPFKG